LWCALDALRCLENYSFDDAFKNYNINLNLVEHYPERKIFHFLEVTTYFQCLIRNFIYIKDFGSAQNKLKELNQIDEKFDSYSDLKDLMYYEKMKYKEELLLANRKKANRFESNHSKNTKKIYEPTIYHHPVIGQLINLGFNLPDNMIEEILGLPRKTLIEDLEKIFGDIENRYYYGKPLQNNNFTLHALYFLGAIQANESVPAIITFLQNSDAFLYYNLGEHRTENLWWCFCQIGMKDLSALKQILLAPFIDEYSKGSITNAITQILFLAPEKRGEILKMYTEVFTEISNAPFEDDIVDPGFLSWAAEYILEKGQLIELLPLFKDLDEKMFIERSKLGVEDFEEAIKIAALEDFKIQPMNIFENYQHLNEIYTNKDDAKEEVIADKTGQEFVVEKEKLVIKPINTGPKLGRNDPCHCGSGKKFKKCHGADQ
jgi:hypothetical protein